VNIVMSNALPMPLLGVMVTELPGEPPFAHSDFFQELCLLGLGAGIEVFIFAPNRIHWARERISGYTYQAEAKNWFQKSYELPDLIYDRCFFTSKAAHMEYRKHMRRLRNISSVRFLGHGLPGKWEVMQILRKDDFFPPYLPETCLFAHVSEVPDWLERSGDVILKPQGGSQGKGVLYIKQSPQDKKACLLYGRDNHNRSFRLRFKEVSVLLQWLSRFIGKRPYLLQKYLSLHTAAGIAYDIRSLVQKNDLGRWQLTGMGVRCGLPGSITANLHGGGSASEVFPFLLRQYSEDKTHELIRTLTDLSARIPPVLEAEHGRLAELGIDLGIDRSGRIWILEVNSKPGRSIFSHLPNETARKTSIENPIRYAVYLLRAQRISRTGPKSFSPYRYG
jgi:glutathione synthase/RimK-type ligase-like ATP-grasp enzyme